MLNDNPILSAAIRHVRLPNDMSFVIAYSGSLVHCFSGGGRGLVRKIHACIRQGAQVFEINYVAGAAEPALSRLEYDIYFWMENGLRHCSSSTQAQMNSFLSINPIRRKLCFYWKYKTPQKESVSRYSNHSVSFTGRAKRVVSLQESHGSCLSFPMPSFKLLKGGACLERLCCDEANASESYFAFCSDAHFSYSHRY